MSENDSTGPVNRIDRRFASLREEGKAAFVAYVCAGDPDMDRSLEILHALERAGADVIELGIPFSDPMADGIVNQMAAHRALQSGGSTRGVIDLVRRFRESSELPVVFFTYLNPVYTYGFDRFHHDAVEAGVDGILLLDLPPDEAASGSPDLTEHESIAHIRLIAPTTAPERVPQLAAASEGFIYYVSREGVTGAQQDLAEGIAQNVAGIQQHTDVPVVVGFGISTPEQAAEVARSADGVVVGSAIVREIEAHGQSPDVAERVEAFVKPLVDGAKSV